MATTSKKKRVPAKAMAATGPAANVARTDGFDVPTRPSRTRPQGQNLKRVEREQAQAAFLRAFEVSANITASCKAAGISRETFYQWQEHDETFSLRHRLAEQAAQDVIRAAIHDRAIRGWDEPLTSMGRIVTGPDGKPMMQHKYDSSLLAKLAAARLPEWRPKAEIEHSGSVETNERVVFVLPTVLPIAQAMVDALPAADPNEQAETWPEPLDE